MPALMRTSPLKLCTKTSFLGSHVLKMLPGKTLRFALSRGNVALFVPTKRLHSVE